MTRLDKFIVIFSVFIGIGIIATIISLFVWKTKTAPFTPVSPKQQGEAGVFVSEDGGTSWASLAGSEGIESSVMIFRNSDPEQIYVGTKGQGLWILPKSKNALEQVRDPKNVLDSSSEIFDIAENTESTVLYLAVFQNKFGKILRLDENGTEEIYKNPLEAYGIFGIIVDRAEPPNIRASSGDGNFLETKDSPGRRKWEVISRTAEGIVRIFSHPVRTDTLWAITNKENLYVSDSGGRIWVEKPQITVMDRGITKVYDGVYNAARRTLMLATDYGLTETADDGAHWSSFQTPVPPGAAPITAVGAHPYFADVFWMASGNIIYHTDDGGVSWRTGEVPTQKHIVNISVLPTNPKKLYAGVAK